MTELKHPGISSFLIFTGSALAFWWLFKRVVAKKEKDVNSECNDADSLKNDGNSPQMLWDSNKPILDVFQDMAEKKGDLFKVGSQAEHVTVVNSKDLIRLVGIAKDIRILEKGLDIVKVLKEIQREKLGRDVCKEAIKKVEDECMKTIKAYNIEDRNLNKNVLVEVEKLTEIFASQEVSNKAFSPHRFLNLACTNVISLLILGCRFKYKSKRLKALVEMIEVHLGCFNFFGGDCDMSVSGKIEFEDCSPQDKLTEKRVTMKQNLKKLLEFIDCEVENHKDTFDEKKYRDPIDIYLKSVCLGKSDKILSRLGLETTIVEFFVKGSRQLSCHITWALYFLVEHPDVQNKCHDEIDDLIGQHRKVTWEDFGCLKYVTATLKEVSRLCTVQPISQPFVSTDCFNLGPHYVHKNSIILCNFHGVHMNKKVWNNPNEFCPERFMCSCKSQCCLQLFNYGFDEGESTCPASSMSKKAVFLMFSNLIQKFDFELVRLPHCHNDPPQSSYNFLHYPPSFMIKVDAH